MIYRYVRAKDYPRKGQNITLEEDRILPLKGQNIILEGADYPVKGLPWKGTEDYPGRGGRLSWRGRLSWKESKDYPRRGRILPLKGQIILKGDRRLLSKGQ